MSQARSYRGVSAEERTAARRAALIQTGLDCLSSDGLSGVSVRSVCARSRLTPRYFYESFADLDELLIAVVDAVTAEVAERGLAAVRAAPVELTAQVRALVDAAFGVVAGDERKANALLIAASGYGPLRDRRTQVALAYTELAIANVAALGALARIDRAGARATALFLLGGSTELIAAVLGGTVPLPRERVVDLLTELWTSVLGGWV